MYDSVSASWLGTFENPPVIEFDKLLTVQTGAEQCVITWYNNDQDYSYPINAEPALEPLGVSTTQFSTRELMDSMSSSTFK